jgi:nitrous oxidase accessory protein NosD
MIWELGVTQFEGNHFSGAYVHIHLRASTIASS